MVSQEQAAALIGGRFPALYDAEVTPLAIGWDNTVFLVGGKWIFRFPRREIAVPGVNREIALLPRLAPHLPLPIPVPEFAGAPSGGYPWPFWGAGLVAGDELAEAGLSDEERTHAATDVGEFLRALHDPALVAEAGDLLPVDPMHRAEPALRGARTRDRLAHLSDQGLWRSVPEIERMLQEGDALGPPAGAPVINHGDLHVRHVLVDRRARAVGVIDWGDLCLADPAVDLSLAYGAFAGPARAALLAAYGPVDAERALRARALALSICAALADYAADVGDTTLLAESLAGMARSAAD